MSTKVYAVSRWHATSVAHGAELVAIFSTEAKAQQAADTWNARYGITPHDGRPDGRYANQGEYTVDEWDVGESEQVQP